MPLKFCDAIKSSKQPVHLLIGNGFSIEQNSIFKYNSIFESADFSQHQNLKCIFSTENSNDFEYVIRIIESSKSILKCYFNNSPDIVKNINFDCYNLRSIFSKTLAKIHPETPDSIPANQKENCISFLNKFLSTSGKIFTTNYDLLLYWVLRYGDEKNLLSSETCDGFSKPFGVLEWTHETAKDQNIFNLHGALYHCVNENKIIKIKYDGSSIINQVQSKIFQHEYPEIIFEGTSSQKLKKIGKNPCLHNALNELRALSGSLFTFGFSFSENDSHIREAIALSSLDEVYIGTHDKETDANKQSLRQRVESMKGIRNSLTIHYFCSESAHVWDSPTAALDEFLAR